MGRRAAGADRGPHPLVHATHGGRDLDAVVHADAAIVLGLAAGVLTLDDSRGLVDIDGDEAAARAVLNPRRANEGAAAR
jgi:hypothetical protein